MNRSRVRRLRSPMRSSLTIMFALGAAAVVSAQNSLPQNADWTKPFPPFRMVGNIYWVGSYDLATYLITTPAGNILINTGVGDTAKQIKTSVEQLGFKPSDTKIPTSPHPTFHHLPTLSPLHPLPTPP